VERNLPNASQFGFRDHGMTLQCMKLAYHVTLTFNNMSTASVFLDIEKAFDTTWHSGLLYKLSKSEFPTSLIKLIASFLTNRKFSFGRRQIFCAKKNSGRGASSFLLWPNIVQSLHKWFPRVTLNTSFSVRRWYFYLCDREIQTSCSLQNATPPHCNEVMLWAFEHKHQWREISGDLCLQKTI
jgi:hypothetical protein